MKAWISFEAPSWCWIDERTASFDEVPPQTIRTPNCFQLGVLVFLTNCD